MYKTRMSVFIITIKLAIRRKQMERLHTTQKKKIISDVK